MAVSLQRHQLLHIALKRRVMTLPQELQPPRPLVNIELRPKQQRHMLAG